ncbi:MAG: FG-GAP repeat protein, partial [Planctomycetes bacterium]|nr:FG-GAP repeat protein [Planctomycetota bacterium]
MSAQGDCNLNGIDDAVDISSGTSADCNSNGIPDECELGAGTSQVAGSVLVDSGASGVTSAAPILGDRVGFAPLALPDLNGDGLSDLAIGVPQRDSSTAENVGAVILTGVGPTGASSWASVLDVSVGALGALEVGDRFGAALASLGDIDSNGTLELAVGAPGDDAAGENEGAVWLLRISSGGTLASAGKIAEGSSGFTGSLATGDSFGSAVAAIGDLNDDGTPDLAVGAPRHDEDGENTGAVWILFMEPAGTVLGSTRIDAASPALLGTLEVGDRFGSSVTLLGDLDLDGTTEIAVGAPRRDGGVDNGGAVFICSLDAAGQLVAVQEISGTVGGLSTLPEVGDHFGSSLACIGDHNIDGVPDLVVGRPGSDTGGENAGAVDLLLLNTDGTVAGQQLIAEGLGGFAEDLEVGADFGAGLASAGDLDGDGFLDLLVGAPRTDSTADNAGALWQLTLGSVDNDCDADGIPDECGFDCDGNGQPDACDIAADASLDCDGDGLLDSCEIAADASLDCDLDGILDACEILLDQTLD